MGSQGMMLSGVHKREESWVSCDGCLVPWEWGKRGWRDHSRSFATKLGTRWNWDLKLKDSLESEEHLPDSLTVLSSGLPGSASCYCPAKTGLRGGRKAPGNGGRQERGHSSGSARLGIRLGVGIGGLKGR